MSSLAPEHLERSVVTASSGNHGAAIAMAARLSGTRAVVHAPQDASPTKLEAIRRLGGELILHQGDCLVAERAAGAQADASGSTYISPCNDLDVSPYNDLDVIAGQGGAAIEMLAQARGSIDAVALSVGGEGLMCGIGAVLAARSPRTKVNAAWPANGTSLLRSLEAREAVTVSETPTIADAMAGEIEPGAITIALAMALNPSPVELPEDPIVAAMKLLAEDEPWMVEGAAGLALAGLKACRDRFQDKAVALVLCGWNIALDRFVAAVR